ncbi:hypothetical protein OK016_06290 [Vibrio chagasii]|nr:hypothetical protein [Vibrio chagasii]
MAITAYQQILTSLIGNSISFDVVTMILALNYGAAKRTTSNYSSWFVIQVLVHL